MNRTKLTERLKYGNAVLLFDENDVKIVPIERDVCDEALATVLLAKHKLKEWQGISDQVVVVDKRKGGDWLLMYDPFMCLLVDIPDGVHLGIAHDYDGHDIFYDNHFMMKEELIEEGEDITHMDMWVTFTSDATFEDTRDRALLSYDHTQVNIKKVNYVDFKGLSLSDEDCVDGSQFEVSHNCKVVDNRTMDHGFLLLHDKYLVMVIDVFRDWSWLTEQFYDAHPICRERLVQLGVGVLTVPDWVLMPYNAEFTNNL